MLRDTVWLREQLRIALALVPLAVAGCNDSAAQPPRPMPRCPEGDFCASVDKVKPLAQKDTKTELGCPAELKENYDVEGSGPDKLPNFSVANLDAKATRAARGKGKKDDCCYHWFIHCPGGRPLLDDDAPVVATTRAGSAWGRGTHAGELAPDLRDALAAGWLADALAEHASIASFARATIELMAVGAPPELVAETQRASLDEIDHARAAFALAARYLGRAIEPDALPIVPPRGGGLARVARDVFVEGCIGETIAALCASRAAAGCDDPELAATLRRIADDEARHAALAWKTVAWAVAAGGAPIAAELEAIAAELEPDGALPEAEPLAGALASHGRLDDRARAIARRDAWRDIIRPTLDHVPLA